MWQPDTSLLDRSTFGETDALVPLNKSTIAYAASLVVKTGTGILYGLTIYNSNASAQFVQVFDARDVPGTGAVPATVLTVAGSSNLPVAWLPGRTFQAGIVVCNSSTGPTLTLGSADCWFDAQYVQGSGVPFVNGGTGGGGSTTVTVTTNPNTYNYAQVIDLGHASVATVTATLTSFTGDGETLGNTLGDIQLAVGVDTSADNSVFVNTVLVATGDALYPDKTLIALNTPGEIVATSARYLRVQGDWEDSSFNSYAGPNHPVGTLRFSIVYA